MMRLQKFLAHRGVASRRSCEAMIRAGQVQVNGETVTTPGTTVDPDSDRVCVDGIAVASPPETRRTILLHKPRGYICSASRKHGKTVFDLIDDIKERLVPVGRLDKNSEGLLLMSNDGELVNRITHPRYQHEKAYEVTVSGTVTPATLKRLQSQLVIDGYRIQPAKVDVLPGKGSEERTKLRFILKEGRNRQIRKMCDKVELRIHRLVRTRVGEYSLKGLKPGRWRDT